MNSYLVETDDFTVPISYNILVGEPKSKYSHRQYQSGSIVNASTNPAISKAYP